MSENDYSNTNIFYCTTIKYKNIPWRFKSVEFCRGKFTLIQIKINSSISSFKLFFIFQQCLFQITEEGIKIIVEDSRCIQVCCYIAKEYFGNFHLMLHTCLSFGVKLNVVTECLSIFALGGDTDLKMVYKGPGSALIFILEQLQENLTTECAIKTNSSDSQLDFNMEDDAVENMIVLNPGDFLAFLNDIEKSENEIEIQISPRSPHIQFSTMTNVNSAIKVQIEKTSDMIYSFTSKEVTKYRYKWEHIRFMMRALSLGNSVSLRTDKEGLLCIQVIIVNEGPKQVCLEYFIVPLIDEDTIL